MPTTSSVLVTQSSRYASVILKSGNGAGRRVSFTAQSASLHLVAATSVAGTGSYSFRAIDPVQYTLEHLGSYDDQWTFMDSSDKSITGTFTVYDLNHQVLAAIQFSVSAGGEAVRHSESSDMNLPRSVSGTTTFSHYAPQHNHRRRVHDKCDRTSRNIHEIRDGRKSLG